MLESFARDKIWVFQLILLIIVLQFWRHSNLWQSSLLEANTLLRKEHADSYPWHENWKSLAHDMNCPADGYEGISEQLGRYGFDKTRSPLENKNAFLKQRKSIDTDGLETFFDAIPMGSALVKIRSRQIHISRQRPATHVKLVEEFITDILDTIVDRLPDMDVIFNTWDEPIVLPHHPTLDYYGPAIPLYSESMDNPYVLALLESPQCASASNDVTRNRLNHYFFMRKRLKTHQNVSIPVFSFTTIKNCFDDVTYPGWHYRGQNPFSEEQVNQFPWDEKENVLFWRGSKTGADSNDAELAALGLRSKFVRYALETNKLIQESGADRLVPIDAQFISYFFPDAPDEEAKFQKYHPIRNFTPNERQLMYKYLMMLDGWSFNERLYRYLSSGSVIFRANVFDEWYEHLLVPWKHFIPIKLDLSDLNEKLVWARDHDQEAKAIADGARKLTLKYLNVKFHKCYLTRLLIEYASLLNF